MRTLPLSGKAIEIVRKTRAAGIAVVFVEVNDQKIVARWRVEGRHVTLFADGTMEPSYVQTQEEHDEAEEMAMCEAQAEARGWQHNRNLPGYGAVVRVQEKAPAADPWANAPLCALVARDMAKSFPEEDWDAWKEEMKERDWT